MATEKLNHSRKRGRVGLRGWLLYLLLVCFALTGVTFSRYVASSYGSDAARTAYLGELTVTETGSETYGGKWVVTPGVNITKNARVIFDKGEMACFVFLRLDTPGWTRSADGASFTYGGGLMGWQTAEGWTYLTAEGDTAVYYRTVAAGTALDAAVIADGGRIIVSPALKNSDLQAMPADLAIRIRAVAVQSDGFAGDDTAQRAMTAWEAVKSK